jgi:hypothetical protein
MSKSKGPKYMIVLMLNKKRKKVLYKSNKRTTINEYWRECKTQKKPPYCAENRGRARTKLNFHLMLIYPKNRWAKDDEKFFVQDELGRSQEVFIESGDYRMKDLIPWWEPEKIWDFQQKKHIYYEEMFDIVNRITEHSQIFTLNNKIFVQIDNDVTVYKNKNLNDTQRLFTLLQSDLLKRKRTNFMFVRDVTSYQRKMLYNLLEPKGFSRNELFRHYSY